jgi:5,10-methylene-tetrahydrofolate dehydrogenase/methenyl tetrahydrofolate cyclohydrolase
MPHSYRRYFTAYVKLIIIAAMGRARFLKANMIKDGVVVRTEPAR